MDMHECYVSLDVAKLLKEVGFDWDTLTYYPIDDKVLNERALVGGNVAFNRNRDDSAYSAPTTEVAQRWLREVRGHDAFVFPCNGLYFYTVRKYYHEGKVDYFDYPNKDAFDTYEEALEAGVKKCLELILEKDEDN